MKADRVSPVPPQPWGSWRVTPFQGFPDRGRSFVRERSRFRCDAVRPRLRLSPDSSKGSGPPPRASARSHVAGGAGGGGCASRGADFDRNALPFGVRRYPPEPIVPPILEDQGDGVRQALTCLVLGAALAVGAGDLGTKGHGPPA